MPTSDLINDPWRRFWRTVIAVTGGFLTFAPVYPLILTAINAPDDSNVGTWLAASGLWIATVSGIISRIMAIPAVNDFLANLKLDSYHEKPAIVEPDLNTTVITAMNARNSGEFAGDPAH